MSNLNNTLVNMSREELQNEIINLKSTSAMQSQKIENYEQKFYELKRQLSTAKAMEEHLSSEIESLQKDDKSVNDKKKISILEEEIHNLKQTNAESVQHYETELQNKNIEIGHILDNIKSKPKLNIQINNDEINKYTDEIYDLKLKIGELTEQLLEHENKFQETLIRNNSLENQITGLSCQLNELRDCLQVKKEELEESKELARNLQDDLIVMQMEIDKFKSLPMTKATKGNSLFAEVDDNRVKLQKTMEIMKKKYMEMKTNYSGKCQELQKLHLEYAALIKVVENKNNSSEENFELEQIYERHFERLKEHVKSLENELELQKQAFNNLISKDWKCAQEMISVTRNEVRTLQRKLDAESLGVITSESNHYKTKRELKIWQTEALQLRAQILSLNQTIEELKLIKSPPVAIQNESNNIKKSCLINTPFALFSPLEDWDLDEKCADYSIFNLKSITDNQIKDLNSTSNISENYTEDYSVPEFLKFVDHNLMDELKSTIKVTDKGINKENITDNKNITTNDTTANLSSQMKKVSFEDITEGPQRTKKLGGRKIFNAQPVHIPSIKRK